MNINLLPWRQSQRERLTHAFNTWMSASAFLALVIGGMMYFHAQGKINDANTALQILNTEIQAANKKILKIDEYKKVRTALIERMKVVQTLQSTRILTIHLLDELVKIIPDGVFLTSIQRVDNKITILGYAESNTDVSEFMRNIESNEWIYEPRLTQIKRPKEPAGAQKAKPELGNEFQLTFVVKSKKNEKRS